MAKLDFAKVTEMQFTANKTIVALSPMSAAIVLACGVFFRKDYNWIVNGETPTENELDEISKATALLEYEVQSSMIGMIIPNVLAAYTGLEILPCDGSTYLKSDYPELSALIAPEYEVDPTHFRVPNLQGKFPLGSGDVETLGSNGGEKEHTLTIAEMPNHNHDYQMPTFNVDIESVGVPDPTGVGNPPQVWSTTYTGGDSPHNNMPPYEVINYGIVAR